ncbi:MAG: gamma-glutamyltransferase [Gemmatimonadaceae bacterium]
MTRHATRAPRRRSHLALLGAALAAAAAGGCRAPARPAAAASPATGAFPEGWRFPAGSRRATVAEHAMVASNSELASAAGAEVMRRGGNAVDAAVATGFALAVTHPEAGNLGGGGYMVIRMADGRVAALDYREVAPLAASRDMFLGPDGKTAPTSIDGHLASGVPGAVAGMAEALRKYGTMSLRDVMQPAIRLAEQGFEVDSALAASLAAQTTRLRTYAAGSPFFPNGAPIARGARLAQPDLARTLRAIAERGPDAFYRGEIADSLVAEMRRGGGVITRDDLARYRPEWREPLRSTYRGHTLFSMPPSSSGGITVTETLNILESGGAVPPFGSAAYAHLLGSAYQRAFVDRNAKLGDPAFVDVPLAQLTSKAYAARLRASIAPGHATPTAQLPNATAIREGNQTTHYSVVDAAGNAVATTTTINELYGSGVWVRGAGFFMNDEMDDFATRPGQPNMFGLVQGEQNAIAPGKRMLSAMSPTIVLDPAGKLLLVVGGRGGPRIITSTSQVILNVIDHHMSLADALSAPRIHHQALPDSLRYEPAGLSPAVLDSLGAMGHAMSRGAASGTCAAVMRVPGGWAGMVDPRASGGAAGY